MFTCFPQDPIKSESPTKTLRRAWHTKSHSGCLTCKQRHIRCDQAQPVCLRCQKGKRHCTPAEPASRPLTFRGFANSTPQQDPFPAIHRSLPSQPAGSSSDDLSSHALSFFYRCTLPVLERCQPSPLWNCLVSQLMNSSALRNVSIAVGHQHRLLDDHDSSSGLSNNAAAFRNTAIRAVRESMNDGNDIFRALACLLLGLLESLRSCADEALVHLSHGLRIARQSRIDNSFQENSPEFQKIVALLKYHSVGGLCFDYLAQLSNSTHLDLFRENIDDHCDTDPLSSAYELCADTLRLLNLKMLATYQQAVRLPQRTAPTLEDLEQVLERLKLRRKEAERHIELRKDSSATGAETAVLDLAVSLCLVSGLHQDATWTGSEMSYDAEMSRFRRILELQESALAKIHLLTDTFSVGLGTIPCLFMVAMRCRDPVLRRKALQLLEQCPQREGSWQAKECRDVSAAIMNFEESRAGLNVSPFEQRNPADWAERIGKSCRVCHYKLDADFSMTRRIRLFYPRALQSSGFAYSDEFVADYGSIVGDKPLVAEASP